MLHTPSKSSGIRCCPVTGRRRVAILGATGSIGSSAVDVIQSLPEKLCAFGISARNVNDRFGQLVNELRPRVLALSQDDVDSAEQFTQTVSEVYCGGEAVERLARHPEVDIVLCAIVGAAGLQGSRAALSADKALALANKETLVVAGPLIMRLAQSRRCPLLPVDSEHSAIHQILEEKGIDQVERIVLTASGGPFRGWSRRQLEAATIEQALQHPTWKMGPKITVDSATLMNKALEIIEARWLFGLAPEQIEVVIHPESVVHSFVEFRDGSVIAQLSPPDMRLPIQYALTYPERLPGPARRLDWQALRTLSFEQPDRATFESLDLGFEVARRGGTAGAAFNAANEAAVERFLAGAMKFLEIAPACREIVSSHRYQAEPTFDDLMQVDRWARQEIEHWKLRT